MAGADHPASATVRHHTGGYIDHKITIVIVLVLAAVAGSRFWPLLPGTWTRFLVLTAVLGVVGTAAVLGVGVWSEGRALRPEPGRDRTVIRMPGAVIPAAAVLLCVLSVHFLVHAWIGEGWLWWGIAAVGVAAGGLGAALLGWAERVVIEPGRVALETTLFGRTTPTVESRWDPPVPPEVEVAVHVTGGAFGQPRVETHRLRVNGETVYDGQRERAEALRDAVLGALGPAEPTLSRILLRLDAEPPYREGWKTRPPGWDDPAGDGVSAALSRSGGFRGLTVFDLRTGRVQWLRDPESARDLEGPLGSELFERLEPLAEDEVRALGDEGIREIADAFLRSRGFAP